ncbi:Ribokinase-like protein [Polychytrium aggregatum]|uniref:Ribokinase-like protein n=1 Tax=Polychytrium aggregatum TaxID=110093 RepID=UPI0022FE5152|nr:Ribokinase-like protein [Polychytrium aggregatum]KAI9208157.1 Ribokinase-like protein [Polychytrium aggregatum]
MPSIHHIFSIGSINIDTTFHVPHIVRPGETLASTHISSSFGGKGANASCAMRRAVPESVASSTQPSIAIHHAGRVGIDGAAVRSFLESVGVQINLIDLDSTQHTGQAIIQVDAAGENAIVLFSGANHTIDERFLRRVFDSIQQQYQHQRPTQRTPWIVLQNEISHVAAAISLAASLQFPIVLTPTPVTPSLLQYPIASASLLCFNRGEAACLASESMTPDPAVSADHKGLMARLGSKYPSAVLLVTLGADGSLLGFPGVAEVISIRAAQCRQVVDTTGAGDTFVGYFVVGLSKRQAQLPFPAAESEDIRRLEMSKYVAAANEASAAAALCVERSGAMSAIPVWSEVQDRL